MILPSDQKGTSRQIIVFIPLYVILRMVPKTALSMYNARAALY